MSARAPIGGWIVAAVVWIATGIQGADLRWDPAKTGSSDGSGTWLGSGVWYDGANRADWNNSTPDNALIGNGGAGGTITLGGNVTAESITFGPFTGTYTVQGTGNTLTIYDGIIINNTAANVVFRGTGSGTSALTITGAGGITMNGPGVLTLRENLGLNYTGPTVINNGVVMVFGNKPSGNFTLDGGMLTDYYRSTTVFSGGLGAGANQIQIYGQSGFGGGNGNSTWRIGTSGSTLIWGSTYFNPTTLKFLAPGADNMGPSIYGQVTLDNKLDLNGGARTVSVAAATGVGALVNSWAQVNGITDSSSPRSGSLTKIGGGNLIIGGTSDKGDITIAQGSLRFASLNAMPYQGTITVNDGAILGIKLGGSGNWTTGTSGPGTLGGLLAGVGRQSGSDTTVIQYNGNVGLLLDVAANVTYAGDIGDVGTSLRVYKIGSSTLTLSGNNTYSGGTEVLQGTLNLGSATAVGSGPLRLNSGITLGNTSGSPISINPVSNTWEGGWTYAGPNDLNLGTGPVTVPQNQTITVSAGKLVVGGPITVTGGNNGFTKAGAGTLTLMNPTSTLSGAWVGINDGVLEVFKLANGGQPSSIGNSGNANANLVFGGSGVLRYIGVGDSTDRRFDTTAAAGSTFTFDASGTGPIKWTATGFGFRSASANRSYTLVLAGTNQDDNTFAANIANNGTGIISLRKEGAGKWILTGNCTYSGGTDVQGGTLLVNNTAGSGTGTGQVTVRNGAKLGGTGIIAGPVTVESGGTLAPGASPGSLTILADLTMNSGSVFEVELNGLRDGEYDYLVLNGALALDSPRLSVILGFTPSLGDQFEIVRGFASRSGTFEGLPTSGSTFRVGSTEFEIVYNDSDITLTVVPEPSTLGTLMLAMAAGVVLRRRLLR